MTSLTFIESEYALSMASAFDRSVLVVVEEIRTRISRTEAKTSTNAKYPFIHPPD
jgi:hypothetical protein